MKEDLNKAQRKWAQRRLFAPPPRRFGRWLWPLLLLALIAVLYRFTDGGAIPLL